MKQKKSIKSRIMAAVGAIFLTAYAMTDAIYVLAESIPLSTEWAYKTEAADNLPEETIDETEMPEEELSVMGEISDEEYAETLPIEEMMPAAGYEESEEEEFQPLTVSPVVSILAADDENSTPSYSWDDVVKISVAPDAEQTDSLIKTFTATYSSDILESSDQGITRQNENGEDVYTDEEHYIERTKNFGIKYTITLNTTHSVDKGNAVIRIPSELFKDRYGNGIKIRDKDGIALPLYSVPPTKVENDESKLYEGGTVAKSTRTQFGYYIEKGEDGKEYYVIVNYDDMKPGSTWFEIVYDEIKVFDVVDETEWKIEPEITINYKFPKERYVYTGITPLESTNESTLKPISYDWQEYLNTGRITSDPRTLFVYANDYGNYYAVEYPINEALEKGAMVEYFAMEENTPVLKYRMSLSGEYQKITESGEWVTVREDEKLQQAYDEATIYEKDGNKYYSVMTTRTVNGQQVQVYTYYDSEGNPVWQEQITNGSSEYFKAVGDENSKSWQLDSSVKNELPTNDWDYQLFSKSDTLEGKVDTEAKLDSVDKYAGEVAQNVKGDLNSESQLLSFIPSNQRNAISGLNFDENIYVLWEIKIDGDNCTQPFELYMDEYTSYYNRQNKYEGDSEKITYTYYDKIDGRIYENVTDEMVAVIKEKQSQIAAASNDADKAALEQQLEQQLETLRNQSAVDTEIGTPIKGGEIIWVEGAKLESGENIPGYFVDDEGKVISNSYSTIYTDENNNSQSNGYWYIGSSDPVVKGGETTSPAKESGLTGVKDSGKYTKKVKVIVAYPRGEYPAEGNSSDWVNGVCIDSLEKAENGEWVYLPSSIVLEGYEHYDGTKETYDLDILAKAKIKENIIDELAKKYNTTIRTELAIAQDAVLTEEQKTQIKNYAETHYSDEINTQLSEKFYDDIAGNLIEHTVLKDVLHDIVTAEIEKLTGVTNLDVNNISPILKGFIEELAENLPKTSELKSTLEGKTKEEIEKYIIESLQADSPNIYQQHIQKACEDYLDAELEGYLKKLTKYLNENISENAFQGYNEKKIYREVGNDVNVVIKPLDNKDPDDQKDDDAIHQRIDREPNVEGSYNIDKTASGGKKGWIDMYDSSEDSEFRSTFKFNVTSDAISFNETHPKNYAYLYDNKSYVHLITADDILTAEPWGKTSDNKDIYGASYVLDEKDYCYTAAKIIVNEKIYNIVDFTSDFGATPLTDDALITKSLTNQDTTDDIDCDWHIYVSYGTDTAGNTIWEEYDKISMEDYLQDSANYNSDSTGKHVLSLDFLNDGKLNADGTKKLPFRIKVEHNTIDYFSTVKLELTAAIRKNAPHIKKLENTDSDTNVRNLVYYNNGTTAVQITGDTAEEFKIRFRNYAAFHAQKYELSESGDSIISEKSGDALGNGKEVQYNLLNRDKVAANSDIEDDNKLTDETKIPGTAIDKPENEIMRNSREVDVSKLEKESKAEKKSNYENDMSNGRVHITYRIAGYEGYLLDSSYKDDLKDDDGNYKDDIKYTIPGRDRHTIYIYDLLPPGVEFEGFSGTNEKPVAGFLKQKGDITNFGNWIDTDKIAVSAEVVGEDSEEWATWGGANNGRYLVKFTLTLSDDIEPEDYAVIDGGNWFFGCGVQFSANVSWERYTAAKNTPNLAAYVTDTETIGKHGVSSKNEGTYMDNGTDVPMASESGYQDIYAPFRNTDNNSYKTNFDKDSKIKDENENEIPTPITTYNRMYAKSMDLKDIARASSTAIGKQVRADADTFALYGEKTAVIKGEGYTYNITIENQSGGAVSSVILYDVLESAGDDTNWKGIFQSVDTSILELNHIYPVVYYYTGTGDPKVPKPDSSSSSTNWQPSPSGNYSYMKRGEEPSYPTSWESGWSTTTPTDKTLVKAIAILLYSDSAHTVPYVLDGKQTLSYKISMKSKSDTDLKKQKYAKNKPNYCYCKVEKNVSQKWVVDDSDYRYYDDPGNITVVTLGERRMLKVAKHVESNYSDIDEIKDTEFTFRITRRMGYYDGDTFKEDDLPCANIRYKIYTCTFDENRNIETLGKELDGGVIHTTNENGEFILHDGECAVFQYVPSTTVLNDGETTSDLQKQYDFDNYKITELSKPFWYEFKSVDTRQNQDAWYQYDAASNVNNTTPESPQPSKPYDTSSSTVHYRQTGITVTNTYRPVIYIEKDVEGVPADMPTNPEGEVTVDEEEITRKEAFNTFDYELYIYEYPINRMTGTYFSNDEGYTLENDTNNDGKDDTDENIKAAWLKFKEYYNTIGNKDNPDNGTYFKQIADKILALNEELLALNAVSDKTDAQKQEIEEKAQEKEAWENLKNALIADKEVIDAHIQLNGVDTVFAPPKELSNGTWTGTGYLMYSDTTERLILPISGFAETPRDKTYKKFSNKISGSDGRENGGVLYSYTVGHTTDIYSTPEGWRSWESEGTDNRRTITATKNPIIVKVVAGNVVALPIYIDGGMMYSDYGFSVSENETELSYNGKVTYMARYCYEFQEAMDNKYWDDAAGEYKTVNDTSERSWLVQTPTDNEAYRNTLGVMNENVMDYLNNYRFKDIYLQKNVNPADHVPKGDSENSVDKTAFIYKVKRRKVGSSGNFEALTPTQYNRMSWELWTRDETGKLIQKLMVGAVNDDGTLLVPFANYTDTEQLYTIKIRHAEVGYTYQVSEILKNSDIFGTGENIDKKAVLENKFQYITYDSVNNTFTYKYDTSYDKEKVFYPTGSTLINDKQLNDKQYILATEDLYAFDASDTSGAVKTSDNNEIKSTLTKVDMEIDNMYKLRNLTVTKSIVAKTIDNDMSFTMRVRREDGKEFPTSVKFYKFVDGIRTPLTAAEVNDLQGVSEENYQPSIQTMLKEDNTTVDYYYLEFKLKNGIYAEFTDIGKETETFWIQEKDWDSSVTDYIHLDPLDNDSDEWSAWKNVQLGDDTVSTIRNGGEGYIIISKTYLSNSTGDYDTYAKSILENDANKISLKFEMREKNSGLSYQVPIIPENQDFAFVGAASVSDLSDVKIKGGQSVVIDLKGLCEANNINFDEVEYQVIETIPESILYFNDSQNDVLYSVENINTNDDLQGDKSKTSVNIQNQVTKYNYKIYKRIGGKTTPEKPSGELVLELRDGGNNGNQAGVKWIATGEKFDNTKNQTGTTDTDGKLKIKAFDGWSNSTDGNLTYFAKIYFNKNVKCNLVNKNNANILEIKENMQESDKSWGYLIGYENYGVADTYVSESALESKEQWREKQDTIVNAVETLSDKKVEVYKQVKPAGNTLTDEEKNQAFTFTVKQFVNGVYEDAYGISYEIYEGDTKMDEGVTGTDGSFPLKHGQRAVLDLPLFCYWEITETGKGDYRLLVDDNGEIVYDKETQYVLDTNDGLAPDQTAAETYNAKRAASGFMLNTDLDIKSGIMRGEDVILIRMLYGDSTQSNKTGTDYWRCGIRFAIPKGTNHDIFYKTSSTLINDNNLIAGVNHNNTNGTISTNGTTLYSGLVKQLAENTNSFEDVSVTEIYAYNKEDISQSVLMWSKDNPNDSNFLGKPGCINKYINNTKYYDEHSLGYTNKNFLTNDKANNGNESNYHVVIPEHIYVVYENGDVKLHKVVGIGRCAGKSYNTEESKSISSLTIPKSVKEIGDYAFYKTSKLKDITFSVNPLNADNKYTSNLKKIGDCVFHDTSSIEHIYLSADGVRVTDHYYSTFPEGLESLGVLTFGGANGNLVGNMIFPDSLINMGRQMFNINDDPFKGGTMYIGNQIESVKVTGNNTPENNVISLGSGASNTFNRVPKPYTIIMGDGVRNIATDTLKSSFNMHELILPDSGSETLNFDEKMSRLPALTIVQNEADGFNNIQNPIVQNNTTSANSYIVFTNISSAQQGDILSRVFNIQKYDSTYKAFSTNQNNGFPVNVIFADELTLSKISQIQSFLKNLPIYTYASETNYSEMDINWYWNDSTMFSAGDIAALQNVGFDITSLAVGEKKGMSPQACRILLDVVRPKNITSYPAPPRRTPENNLTYLAEALWLNEKRRTI